MDGSDGLPLRSLRRLIPALVFIVAACEAAPIDAGAISPAADAPAIGPAPQVVIDSGLPMPDLIARFQASGGVRPEALAGGAHDLEPLVRRYVSALANGDTTALRSMSVSRAEYAHLVFPGSMLARPPYELNPEVAWLMQSLESEKGVRRALAFVQSRGAAYAGFDCPAAIVNGVHRIWRGCEVIVRHAGGSTTATRLFGEIIEVEGHYKFLSYANPLTGQASPS